ncbi:glycosyltransferase family 2 protein [Thalassiella azotivora]
MTELSVVVPVYDEAEALPHLVRRLRPVLDGLGCEHEVVVVDDGSRDATPVLLQRLRREWPQLRVVRLRVNAGHQAALSAGLSAARGRWVVSLDADLQDPPEVIPRMLDAARRGEVDVVFAVRTDRRTDSWFKRSTARAFYGLMGVLARQPGPVDAGDFRLLSRATVDAVNALPEQHRVLRLVVPALGFPSAQVTYRREARVAGRSKYPVSRMLRLTLDSVTGYSVAPLRLATWFGLLGGLSALALLVYALVANLTGRTVAGWTSTVVTVAAVGAVQLLCLGVLGEYVGRLYSQLQGRPTYYVAYDSLRDGARGDAADAGGGAPAGRAGDPSPGALTGGPGAQEPDGPTRHGGQRERARTSRDTPGTLPTGR